jgi:Serine proteases of the peptidase family S9A
MKNTKQPLQKPKSANKSAANGGKSGVADGKGAKQAAQSQEEALRIKNELDRLFDLIKNESKTTDMSEVVRAVEASCKQLVADGTLTKAEKDRLAVVLYTVHRAEADRAFERGESKRARDCYLRTASKTPIHILRQSNRLSGLYAGAGVMTVRLKRYKDALDLYEKSARAIFPREQYCLQNIKYLGTCLLHINSYLKTAPLKKRFARVVDIVRKKMSTIDGDCKPNVPYADKNQYTKHGVKVADPYLYFESENPNLRSWLNSHHDHYSVKSMLMTLDLQPQVDYYAAAYAQLHSVPYKVNDYYYFHKRDRTTSHTTVSRAHTLKGRRQEILSAASVCERDEWFEGLRVQENGNFIAYGVSKRGSDIETWTLRNMKTGRDLKDHKLEVANGWIMFHPDGKGIVYRKIVRTSKDSPLAVYGKEQSIFYHSFKGKKQRDKCLYTPTGSARWLGIDFAFDGDLMVIAEWLHHSHDNHIILKASSKGRRKRIRLFNKQSGTHRYIGEIGNELFFLTNHKAPKRKLVAVEIDRKTLSVIRQRTMIPECDSNIKRAYCLEDSVLVEYMDKTSGRTVLIEADLAGRQKTIKLPIEGTLSGISHTKGTHEILFSMSNFGTPSIIYRLNLRNGKPSVIFAPTFKPGIKIVEEVVKVKGKDGTEIPMLVARLNSVKPNPNTPVEMHVYGGFGVSMQSSTFSYDSLCWFAMGGMLAIPYLRGGSEMGEDWHRQATRENKQRTFDDAIACAEWLIKNRYTSARKLAITGGSNGGLTVAACITQRPDLFGAAIGNNGLYDMLRYETHTIGWAWASEYGTTRRKKEFLTLKKYSPYHFLASGKLPGTTGDSKAAKSKGDSKASKSTTQSSTASANGKRSTRRIKVSFPKVLLNVDADDDRVAPWHTYKFAAALQKYCGDKTDILLRVESKRGHGNSRPSNRLIEELAFLQWALEMRT